MTNQETFWLVVGGTCLMAVCQIVCLFRQMYWKKHQYRSQYSYRLLFNPVKREYIHDLEIGDDLYNKAKYDNQYWEHLQIRELTDAEWNTREALKKIARETPSDAAMGCKFEPTPSLVPFLCKRNRWDNPYPLIHCSKYNMTQCNACKTEELQQQEKIVEKKYIGVLINPTSSKPGGSSMSGVKVTRGEVEAWASNVLSSQPSQKVLVMESIGELELTAPPLKFTPLIEESKSAIYNPEDPAPADHDYTNHMSTRIGNVLHGEG